MPQAKRSPLGLLLIFPAALFMAFGNGHAIWWPATWLGIFFLARVLRTQPFWRGLLIAWPPVLLAWIFSWAAVFRLQGVELGAAAAVLSLISLVPFALDRLLASRLPPLLSTLVLPCAYVANEYALTLLLPYGSWGSIAYSQAPLSALTQIAAYTGMWGVTFLVAWGASTANLAWERRGRLTTARAAAAVYGLVLLAIVAVGLAERIEFTPAVAPEVAMVLPRRENNENYELRYSAEIQNDLFARSAAAASDKVLLKFIVWPEDSLAVLASDEAAFLERARRFAAEHQVYLQVSYGRRFSATTRRYENKTVMVGPDGRVVWNYRKSFAVPGYEQRNMIRGDGRVPVAVIDGMTYAAAICFDGDHREIMRQAANADVLFLPSDDWAAITDLHADMTRMRAIEYGLKIVRPTINGRAAVFNYAGRAETVIEPGAKTRVARAFLNGHRTPTFYGRFGDWFAWAASTILLLLGGLAVVRPQSKSA